ncbi:hypothetical protein AJ79_07371 [Helicocarpus griseus UAMH5409]|uniref:PH-response regulator protein palH/RIM21 n=1 Tax=Helicocarpus griseus UAMH5409 TaxID=1447875 RepID=A0A2B7X3A1_9EURO|nr:hypothetical protein AJ79_07371 [Helicocarpus griseus UAMH5409]
MSFVNWLLTRNESDHSHPYCPAATLRQGGTIIINDTFTINLTANAIYKPQCANAPVINIENPTTVADGEQPFYASTAPQMYAIATATVIAYLLVIILFITPRTFFIGGRGGGASFLSRRGMIRGSYGSSSVIGIGGRPWLQKVAALCTAISLSIATADTFRVAKHQFDRGYMDSSTLAAEVIGGVEIRAVRVISSTFLWLAQVQTLIRLFPRHKEKVIIKWTGFALIVLDTIFSILNSFIHRRYYHVPRSQQPRHIVEAIPALNYLFDLSLSLLYAAWVIFYGLSKHRFAFFHVKMRNICLVALLSLASVLIPIVFFVLDLSKPSIASWGEYIRWVGAAAASVVVWEWVERIEALERDERKDGILGREIFDGDEMLDVTPSEEVDWPGSRNKKHDDDGGSGSSSGWGGVVGLSNRPLRSRVTFPTRLPRAQRLKGHKAAANGESNGTGNDNHPTPPPLATTPVSRADTVSAASTVYRVRFHSVGSLSSSSVDYARDEEPKELSPVDRTGSSRCHYNMPTAKPIIKQGWVAVSNPFKRRRASPPTEVATAHASLRQAQPDSSPAGSADNDEKDNASNVKSKLDTIFTYRPWDKRTTAHGQHGSKKPLRLTVIPAPVRGSRLQSPEIPRQEVRDTATEDSLGTSNDARGSDSELPVMVIPAQPRSERSWSRPTADPSSQAGDLINERRNDPFDRSSPTAVGTSRTLVGTPQADGDERTRSHGFGLDGASPTSTTDRASPNSISWVHGQRPDPSAHDWGGGRRTIPGRSTDVPMLREEEGAIIQVVHIEESSDEDDDNYYYPEQSVPGEGHTAAPFEPVSPSSSSGRPAHSRHISFSNADHSQNVDRDRDPSNSHQARQANVDGGSFRPTGSDLEAQR